METNSKIILFVNDIWINELSPYKKNVILNITIYICKILMFIFL